MAGEILFWAAVIFVVVMLLPGVLGNLGDWRATGFYAPPAAHAGALFIVAAFFGPLEAWPLGLAIAAFIYLAHGAFGSHRQASLLEAEKRAGRDAGSEAGALLAAELEACGSLPRVELVALLFNPVEKHLSGPGGAKYRSRIQVLPASYAWGGGNASYFEDQAKQVADGAPMKVFGLLVPEGRSFLRRRGRVSLSLSR